MATYADAGKGTNMARLAWHEPSQHMIDFCGLSTADRALATSLHGNIPRGSGILRCPLAPGAGPDSELLVKLSDHGNYFAAHFPGDAHDGHDAENESIEHHRIKDYWQGAAQEVGLTAVTELPIAGGVLDVAITGGKVATDVEVQHTPIRAATVAERTRTYARAGWLPVWFHDAAARPKWLNTVPGMGSTVTDWASAAPRRGTVKATGLGYLRELRCTVGTFGGGCPMTRARRPCGQLHPLVSAGVTRPVEEVAELVAAGDLVALSDWRGLTFLIRSAQATRYADMTGGAGSWDPGTVAARPQRAGAGSGPPDIGDCEYDHTPAPAPPSWPEPPTRPVVTPCRCDVPRGTAACGEPARLYACGWRCDGHRPRPQLPAA
jgi:hypothetical protein